jgi:hypothetical protein
MINIEYPIRIKEGKALFIHYWIFFEVSSLRFQIPGMLLFWILDI